MYSCPRPGTERHERLNCFSVVTRSERLGLRNSDESSAINDGAVPLERLSTDDINDSVDKLWAVLEAGQDIRPMSTTLKAYRAEHPQPYLKKVLQG